MTSLVQKIALTAPKKLHSLPLSIRWIIHPNARGCHQSFPQCHKRIAQARFDAGEEAKAFSQKMTNSRRAGLISNVRSYLARLFTYAVLLVFGAVTLAWWGFLAWLIWR